MESKKVLIVGSGHLAYRIKKMVSKGGYDVSHFSIDRFRVDGDEDTMFEKISNTIKGIDLAEVKMVYLVDDNDEHNLELMIALVSIKKDLHITASFFNENIAPHLKAGHPNIEILNPAKLAAPIFVHALDKSTDHNLSYVPSKPFLKYVPSKSDLMIRYLVLTFLTIIALSVSYFHYAENISWVDSAYFVVVTIATVGYGDINLLNSSSLSKVVDISLILSSTFFIWVIFSLTIDNIIRKRVQLSLGRKKYSLKNHVILCGLGRLGYFIAEELLDRGEKLLIIEKNDELAQINYLRHRGAEVYIGDARLPRVLMDAGVSHAKAVFSVVNNDYTNLEIGLNARSFEPNMKLILRIFDESMAQKVKENLDIHLTYSMSAIVDDKFFAELTKKKEPEGTPQALKT